MGADKNIEKIKIVIKCITGNEVQLEVDPIWTVEDLKEIVSKKLDVPVDNFSIQSKYRELISGTLASNEIIDGSEVVLVMAVKSGWKEFKRVDDPVEVLNSVSDKEMENFFCRKTFLCFDARIGDEMLKIRLKLDRLKPPAISERKPRKRKRKCCLPKKVKSPKTCNSDKVSVTKMTECDGSSRRSDSGGGDNKIELLTIINMLNKMLSERLASTSTFCGQSNDLLRSHEELEQKLKTQRTMEKILEKLRKRKLRKQGPKSK